MSTDPAKNANVMQKLIAFEWLRSVAISERDESKYAAILMYEISNLRTALDEMVNEPQPLGIDRPTYQHALGVLLSKGD